MVQRILRRRAVEKATGLSRSTIYALMEAGKFPKPLPIGTGTQSGAVGWLESEVEDWQKGRIAERDAKSAAAAGA